jgi:hypothetical protein
VYGELAFLVFIALYLVNMLIGSSRNERLAMAWARHFAGEDGLLDRNFSHIGICELRSMSSGPLLIPRIVCNVIISISTPLGSSAPTS